MRFISDTIKGRGDGRRKIFSQEQRNISSQRTRRRLRTLVHSHLHHDAPLDALLAHGIGSFAHDLEIGLGAQGLCKGVGQRGDVADEGGEAGDDGGSGPEGEEGKVGSVRDGTGGCEDA